MIGRNDPCWCGSCKKWKKCHFPDKGKWWKKDSLHKEYWKKHAIRLKTEKEIEGIRQACALAARILEKTCEKAKVGVTTQELNDFAHALHLEVNAKPAPLNYGEPPFPKSICTSLNEVICHGIPNGTPLKEGDVINIDVTCILNGYYGDCSRMIAIGKISEERSLVYETSYECLMHAIKTLKPGVPLSVIGEAIEAHAEMKGCSVVNQFVGHGVGVEFHENPQIPHYRNGIDTQLVPGMTFTIEPMINAGVREAIIDPNDQWTARTQDGRASGQWEHTLLITEEGYEILTPWKKSTLE